MKPTRHVLGARVASPLIKFAMRTMLTASIAGYLYPATGNAGDSVAMWGSFGRSAGSSVSAEDRQRASSEMHVSNGVVAGQVNAARKGILYQGTTINVTSVGSQSVISTTIIGDGNEVDIDADQSSSNSGEVSNDAQLFISGNDF